MRTCHHSQLTKWHNVLAYHRVPEAIAAKVLFFQHMPGEQNPSDVLTKSHAVFAPLIKYVLFWKGNTSKAAEVAQD
jgi:hypothetical protein